MQYRTDSQFLLNSAVNRVVKLFSGGAALVKHALCSVLIEQLRSTMILLDIRTVQRYSCCVRYTDLFSPSIVSESHIGFFSNPETIVSPQDSVAANQRSTVGFNVSQFSPVSNSLNLMPN